MEPQVLDLTGLQWERADAYYLDFTPETSKNFFTVAAQLVLWETKQKAIVLASRDDIGRRLGSELNNRIVNTWDSPLKRLSIDLFRIYDPKAADSPKTTASPKTPTFAALVAEVLETPADFIFVAGGEQGSPELIEQLREAGAEQPIICGWDLESELLRPHETRLSEAVRETLDQWLEAEADQPEKPTLGQIVDRLRREMGYDGPLSAVRWYVSERRGKTYVASTFNPYGRGLPVEAFQDRYRRAFGGGENGSAVVDANAVFGYFAVQLVRQAFERGGTASPKGAAVSLKLAASDDWILGNTHFSPSGDLLGLQIVFKQMDPDGTLSLISLPPQPVFAELAGPSLDMIPGAK